MNMDAPPSYNEIMGSFAESSQMQTSSGDPRRLSTDSLFPAEHQDRNGRRKLLLVYIHGFMGDETSFQHFPAHVHSYLAALVAESHVVHTKIYPRYRSKNRIDFARDDFGRWSV